jgi:hypothetical protein
MTNITYLNKSFNLSKLIKFLICIFFIMSLIVPSAIVNKIVFVMILFLTAIDFLVSRRYIFPTVSPFIILFIFIYGFLNSFKGNADMGLSVQFLLSTGIFLLIYPIQKYQINLDRLIKYCGITMVIVTLIFYLLALNLISFPGVDIILELFNKYSSPAIGTRSFFEGNSMLMLHLGTIPFIFLPACLYFKEYLETKKISKLFIVILMVITLILSTSRALIGGVFLGMLTLFYLKSKGLNRFIRIIIIFFIIILSLNYLGINSSVFSADEFSNSVKIGHFNSFLSNITIYNTLFGDGLASYYFTEGTNKFQAHTEITFLDMFRYFGLILTLLLYFSIIFPIVKLNQIYSQVKEVFIIFIIYLGISMTNPVLFNSFGSMVILWYWSILIKTKYGDKKGYE